MVPEHPHLFGRIREDYPHAESLRGAECKLTRDYGDGTVCVKITAGEHTGDSVCLDKRYVELCS